MAEIKIDDKTSVVDKKNSSGISKVMKMIINDDFDKIGETLLNDIFIPMMKNTLATLGRNFVDMVFLGEVSSKTSSGSAASTYHQAGSGGSINTPKKNTFEDKGEYFIFKSPDITSKGAATVKLEALKQDLERNKRYDLNYVTVANLYSICDETPPYTYEEYGWTNLDSASVGMGIGGVFYIKLPRPVPVKKR